MCCYNYEYVNTLSYIAGVVPENKVWIDESSIQEQETRIKQVMVSRVQSSRRRGRLKRRTFGGKWTVIRAFEALATLSFLTLKRPPGRRLSET